MKLIPIEELPQRKRHRLQQMLDRFADSDTEIVKLDFEENEYKSPRVACSVISIAIKRSGHKMKVSMRGNDVFLYKVKG